MYFFKSKPNLYVYSTEQTGIRQFYLADVERPGHSFAVTKTAASNGPFWVCEASMTLYYSAVSHQDPRECHLQSVDLRNPDVPVKQWTDQGKSHAIVAISSDFAYFVASSSSLEEAPLVQVRSFSSSDAVWTLLSARDIPAVISWPATQPFSFTNSNGDRIYGLLVVPPGAKPSDRTRTMLKIYGGPHCQVPVNRTYSLTPCR